MILQHRIQSTGGINTTVDSGVLPETDLVTADNIQFTTSGARLKREGFDYLNTVPTVTHRSSSGTTRTIVFSSTLQSTSPDNDKLIVGEKIILTSTASSGNELNYVETATITAISTTTTTNDTLTFTSTNGSLTESSTATSTLTVKRAEELIGLHDYWYTDSSNAKTQYLMSITDNGNAFRYDTSDRRDLVEGQPEVTSVTTVADSGGSLNNTYFLISAANDSTDYYVWYNVSSGGTDPAVASRTGIEVAISTGDSANTVASATQSAVDAITDFSASVSTNVVTITNADAGLTTAATDTGSTGFTISVTTEAATKTTSANRARMYTFNERCIIAFDETGALPCKYNPDDDAKYQLLGGTPPDFSIAHNYLGRLWTNDKTNPDRLHYSETGNHEVWQGSGDSGALDLVVGDGDNKGITAIFDYQAILYVAKGNRLFRILGNTPENFQVQEVTKGLGLVSDAAIAIDQRDVLFISKRGVHSISATDKYGDTETSFISLKIQQLFDNFPPNLLDNIQGEFIPNLNSVALACPDKGSTYNNSIYLYNTELQEWYRWPNVEAISLTRRVVNGQFRLVWGDRNGRVVQAENTEYTDFSTSGIVYRTKSGTIYPGGDPDIFKRFHYIKPLYKPTGNFEFTVICKIDNQSPQSIQFTQSTSGTKWGDFVLGESVLGVDNVLQPYHETIEGVGRGITLEVVNSGSEEQVEIYGWIIGFEPAGYRAEVSEG